MHRKLLLGVFAAVVVGAWAVAPLEAQERASQRPTKKTPLIDQLDGLGQTIFDGVLSPFQQGGKRAASTDDATAARGHTSRPSVVHVQRGEASRPSQATSDATPQRPGSLPSSRNTSARTIVPAVRSVRQSGMQQNPYASAYPDEVKIAPSGETQSVVSEDEEPAFDAHEPAEAIATADSRNLPDPASRRLHERLTILRQSPFDDLAETEADAAMSPLIESEPAAEPSEIAADEPSNVAADEPAGIAEETFETEILTPPTHAAAAQTPNKAVSPRRPSRAAIVQNPMADSAADLHAGPIAILDAGDTVDVDAASSRSGGDDVLITRKSPVLDVRTLGPRRITVGKPAEFLVTIANSGEVAADEVVITVDLPEWTDVADSKPSVGTADWVLSPGKPRQFQWRVGRIEANGREELNLDVVPRKSQPFDLALRWDYTPAASQTMIEVEEPKLAIRLDGPHEIHYGAREVYRLEVSNYGTGDAENVELSLLPIGMGSRTPTAHKLGLLPSGDTRTVELEVVARQNGELTVEVEASGDACAKARLVEKIVVVRPALKMDVEAPPVQYAGAVAKYRVRVTNPGNAAAKNVKVSAMLPSGARHHTSAPPATLESDKEQVTWTLNDLAPGAVEELVLNCTLSQPGPSVLAVRSTADGDVTATADATTMVQTIADLKLDVTDPPGPVAVGGDATYRVNIQNNGSETARGVDVVAYFSGGIEPVSAEGARYKMGPGQVVFETISSLGVGEKLTLSIHAQAETAGNHVFRVEVRSKSSGIQLAREETTHFFSD